jgi:hypothetical protein
MSSIELVLAAFKLLSVGDKQAAMLQMMSEITGAPAPAPVPAPAARPSIPVSPPISALPEPAPAPHSAQKQKNLLLAYLKRVEKISRTEKYYDTLVRIINTINAITDNMTFNPYNTLIANKKDKFVYNLLFDSIHATYYDSYEAASTQKEKDRKVAILATLQEKYNSHPPEKTLQRNAYQDAFDDIKKLPSSTSIQIYINLLGVGDSIAKEIKEVYNKYE